MARRNTLLILRLVHLESQGFDENYISAETGIQIPQLQILLNTSEAKQIRKEIERRTIDTIAEVQTDAQAAAPVMFKVLQDIALSSTEKAATRMAAAKTVLEMAGHSPVKTVEIRKSNPLDSDYHDKSEDEIRKEIYEGLNGGKPPSLPPPDRIVH